MVIVAQLVRASDCGSEGRGFEPRHSPFQTPASSGVFNFYISTISLAASVQHLSAAQIFRLNFHWRFGKCDNSLFKRKNTKAESEQGVETGSGF